ncbi:MAG: 50S ribosomal protein L22 [Alphaproteobacteria bacterium]|nr:50S ribosomal protein L22 [Alphaproteobacteria bacterium]
MDKSILVQAKAVGKKINMSPLKVRRVLKQINGRVYREALMILKFMPYRACGPIWTVLNSAAANAEHNLELKKETLFIKTAFVNKTQIRRRFRARARGKAFSICKPTCQITIILESK